MGKYRDKKLANIIKQKIASMIIEGTIKDPRITGFITITDVECTKDLKFATVYVSVIGEEEAGEKTLIGLRNASGFIKKQLSDVLTVRWMPELSFKLDDSIEKGAEMYQRLSKLENERLEKEKLEEELLD